VGLYQPRLCCYWRYWHLLVKLNQAPNLPCLRLRHRDYKMLETDTIRIPKPQCLGTATGSAYLVLEWLGGPWETQSWEEGALSGSNALTHQQQRFWLETKQHYWFHAPINTWTADWVEFYTQHRLGYQFALYSGEGIFLNRNVSGYPQLLAHQPQPSLVHGDLWAGMQLYCHRRTSDFDPAVYLAIAKSMLR